MPTPLLTVKKRFESKDKLIAALKELATDDLWIDRLSADRGGAEKGLRHVSNAKLLRLHTVFSAVKQEFGSRAKLIDAIVEVQKRAGDAGYRKRLEAWPVPRLYDTLKSLRRGSRSAGGDKQAAAPSKATATSKGKTTAVSAASPKGAAVVAKAKAKA